MYNGYRMKFKTSVVTVSLSEFPEYFCFFFNGKGNPLMTMNHGVIDEQLLCVTNNAVDCYS